MKERSQFIRSMGTEYSLAARALDLQSRCEWTFPKRQLCSALQSDHEKRTAERYDETFIRRHWHIDYKSCPT